MHLENGYAIADREEMASGNIKMRILSALSQLGEMTAEEMNMLCYGGTARERRQRIGIACWALRRDSKLGIDPDTRKWRIIDE